jgi:hypothetical protein
VQAGDKKSRRSHRSNEARGTSSGTQGINRILEEENARLRLVADLSVDQEMLQEVVREKL